MTRDFIKTLLTEVPRYAEEEGYFYSVERDHLLETLCKRHGITTDIAENTVFLCESLLDSLSLLQSDLLSKGEWCFVSFPAQLMATSLLTVISDSHSRLFEPHFWNTQGISNDKKNRQRDILRMVENARVDHYEEGDAQPIRYCYVAWSIIKLDGKILFYQREDTQKRFDKSAGDYGLLGGRANQSDVHGIDTAAVLEALQSPHSDIIKNALPETLKRELREEAGLHFESHYTFKHWRGLKPYQQVQGAAPNHALTEYYLDIFHIELTLNGYLHLNQQIKTDERLVWFSIEDVARGETTDGKIPYIKALYDEFADDRPALAAELRAMPDSFAGRYLLDREKYGVTLPIVSARSVLAGVLGKEKPLDLSLNDGQLALLLGLAAHLRSFDFAELESGIVFHPYGWVEVENNSSIQAELMNLAVLLIGTDLIIENFQDTFFRLSINPCMVFFDEYLFSFSVKHADLESIKTKIPVIIQRQAIETALGKVTSISEEFKVTLQFANDLKYLDDHSCAIDNDKAIKIEDKYKKGLHRDSKFLSLGLRSLIRREDGILKFVLNT